MTPEVALYEAALQALEAAGNALGATYLVVCRAAQSLPEDHKSEQAVRTMTRLRATLRALRQAPGFSSLLEEVS